MSGWGIFALVLVVFFLIGQIRVGVDARYGEDGPLVKVRLGLIRITVFPFPARDKHKNKKKAKKKRSVKSGPPEVTAQVEAVQASAEDKSVSQSQTQPKEGLPTEGQKSAKADRKADNKKKTLVKSSETPDKKAGKKMSLEQISGLAQEFVPLVLEAVGDFWNKLVMDELEISVTVGNSDPADAAMLYGKIHAAMGAVWQPLSQAFHVKNGRGHVGIDFESQSITLYAHAALSIKIGQVLQLVSHFGVKALRRFIKLQKQQKAKQQARKAV